MMIKLSCFICLWLKIFCEELTLKAVFSESEDAILSRNITKNEEILRKYFLTDNRTKSVWAIAQATAKQVFKVDYLIDDLAVMEQDIRKIGRLYLKCKEHKNEQALFDCFSAVADTMNDATRDFRWSIDPTISKVSRIKYGTMFLTLAVFDAHISLVAIKSPFEKKYELKKQLSFLFERFYSIMYDFEKALDVWRLNQISPVKICEVHIIMWKEFEGTCETRWRRAIDEVENKTVDGINSAYDVESLIDEKVEKIGSNLLQKKKYQASVYDFVNDHQVFQEDIILDTGSRGIGIHNLFQKAKDIRWKYIDSIKNHMSRFNEDIVRAVRSMLNSIIFILKEKT
ncbi:uncharacterized protein LOC100201886 isoform X2 [Hydra vulgaris]|uniref:Uncharacterized protein LOC100201886 isoform X2 n=1 Tax=Hydra vulgaris TaxID=6087 RepID=A0ABM4CKP9_HYDVU